MTNLSSAHRVRPMERLPRSERAAQQREARRASILAAAVQLAEANGFATMKRDQIARAAGVADGSVNHECGSMEGLRDAVMEEAVCRRILPIVAQGLAQGHPAARAAPTKVREAATRALA